MKKNSERVYCLWAILAITSSHAQSFNAPLSSAYTAARSFSRHHADAFAALNNVASLANCKQNSIAVISEQRWSLPELSHHTLLATHDLKKGHASFQLHHSGFANYRETKTGIAYARNLENKIAIGAAAHYQSIVIAGYGTASTITFNTGLFFYLTHQWSAALYIEQPVGGRFSPNEKIPSVYSIGLAYEPSSHFIFYTSFIKEESQQLTIQSGFQYYIRQPVSITAGFNSASSTWWFGTAYQFKNIRIEGATLFHFNLGITPIIACQYFLQKKQS